MARSQSRKKIRRQPAHESFGQQFDRELADVTAALARLEASLPSPLPASKPPVVHSRKRPAQRRGNKAKKAGGHTRPGASPTPIAVPSPPATSATASAPAAAPAPAPAEPSPTAPAAVLPTGTDLADPKNFGVLPPTGDLEPWTAPPEEERKRLAKHLAFANQILHTPRVPAAVWREWRAFEKAAHARLHTLAAQSL